MRACWSSNRIQQIGIEIQFILAKAYSFSGIATETRFVVANMLSEAFHGTRAFEFTRNPGIDFLKAIYSAKG